MKYSLGIEGMSCQHCVKHVKEVLEAIDGVTEVNVILECKTADMTATQSVKEDRVREIIEDAGYELTAYSEV